MTLTATVPAAALPLQWRYIWNARVWPSVIEVAGRVGLTEAGREWSHAYRIAMAQLAPAMAASIAPAHNATAGGVRDALAAALPAALEGGSDELGVGVARAMALCGVDCVLSEESRLVGSAPAKAWLAAPARTSDDSSEARAQQAMRSFVWPRPE